MTSPISQERVVGVKLKPCPFCGPGQSQVDLWHDDVSKRWRVGCGRCGCSTGTSPRDKTQAPAIAGWNTREELEPVLTALQQMVNNFRPFTIKPMGAPNSPARLEQEAQIAAYNAGRAALKARSES